MVGLTRVAVKIYPLRRFDCIYGWFTTICCIDVPFKAGLTVYMVGLPQFVVYMYPLRQD